MTGTKNNIYKELNKDDMLRVIHNESNLDYEGLAESYDNHRIYVTYGDYRTTLLEYLSDSYGYNTIKCYDNFELEKLLQKYYREHDLTIHEKFNYVKTHKFAWLIFT